MTLKNRFWYHRELLRRFPNDDGSHPMKNTHKPKEKAPTLRG